MIDVQKIKELLVSGGEKNAQNLHITKSEAESI